MWIDTSTRSLDTKTIRIRNNTPHEVRILAVEIRGNARLAEELGQLLQPGQEDSLQVDSLGSPLDGRFEMKVHWEKIIRTQVTRTEHVEVPPGEPEPGSPDEEPTPETPEMIFSKHRESLLYCLLSIFFLGVPFMSDATAQERQDFDELWNYDDPAGTEQKFQELLPGAREAGNADYVAQLLTQIARTHSLRQEFEAAHRTLDEVESMLTDDLVVARVRYHLERGRTFNSDRERVSARKHFLEAWNVARGASLDFYAVDAAHMLEIVTTGEEQLEWNLEASRVAEASSSERARGWLGSLYNNRGWTYHDLGRYEEALAVFRVRVEWLEANKPDPVQIRITHWSIGKTLRLLERPQEALEIQRQLAEDPEPDGYVHEELAECLLALDRADEARPHFAEAHRLLADDPWLSRDEPERLQRLEELGRE